MTQISSFDLLLRGGAFQHSGAATPELRPHRSKCLDRDLEHDELRGKIERGKRSNDEAPGLSRGLDRRLGAAKRFGFCAARPSRAGFVDVRQRAIVKIHFFGHSGGGGAALLSHGRYVARDAALREQLDPDARLGRHNEVEREATARAHAAYLSREQGRAVFYDMLGEAVDGQARMAVWAREDRRHFRIILAPENGVELGDLKTYVRNVMESAEAALGGRLEWVAIDHHDTDNPHTHIVLRGRHANGRPLILPREFVKLGLREIARDAATDRLGPRTRADEQAALAREARAHRPTRLDALLARRLDGSQVRVAALEAPNGDPAVTKALKARARELQRLGLAWERRRNVLVFHSDWRDRLRAMELHLDIRKRLVLERSMQQRDLSRGLPTAGLFRGLGR